ncbi:uncharacterized protein PHACADRAFT_206722 [Phanerochaete carnosa HHB-10118-sp]|uniref:Uncharacterized protein n=1 Tax=Phanerochaete carnosa (strain HHB-10118-sp) TaxID=650164 RepID=K5V5E4_PHACS|nr:uncharacterized protein PHACADRAFT_206722 [Phanerochaete carnosa HHB-10118-sp]EKM57851.1 hypothetical protein PHACADRAFT_206722 [Phanerochaete carnosa HHB-10118-sp]
MVTDDLPWPELGNVSRGATRGNQGQKGVLGLPDGEGRAILQLRVQPGVLPVKLNRQATEWYRILDNEVNRALKLTKTYWRKARRRQDYDARADQDHMELHEWLQQLKDKVMSHLELLMQKGEIQGPPYIMPDNVELTFLRKFIERQAAGIPHNPRLRHGQVPTQSPRTVQRYIDEKLLEGSSTSPSMSWDAVDERGSAASPAMGFGDMQSVVSEVETNRKQLRSARAALSRAQRETQESFKRYKSCLDVEAAAMQQVVAAEERRDALMSSLMEACRPDGSEASETSSRKSPYAAEDPQASAVEHGEIRTSPKQSHDQISGLYKPNGVPSQESVGGWRAMREMQQQWGQPDPHSMAGGSGMGAVGQSAYHYSAAAQDIAMDVQGLASRKHSRSWDMAPGQPEIEVSSAMYFQMAKP